MCFSTTPHTAPSLVQRGDRSESHSRGVLVLLYPSVALAQTYPARILSC